MRVEIPFYVLNKQGKPLQGATVKVYQRWNLDGTALYTSSDKGPEVSIYTSYTSTASATSVTTDALGQVNGWVEEGQYAVEVTGANIAKTVNYFEASAANVNAKDGGTSGTFTRAGVTLSTGGISIGSDTPISFKSNNSVKFICDTTAADYSTAFTVDYDTASPTFLKVVSSGNLAKALSTSYASSLPSSGTVKVSLPDAYRNSSSTSTFNAIYTINYDHSSYTDYASNTTYSSGDIKRYNGLLWRASAAITQPTISSISPAGSGTSYTWTVTTSATHGLAVNDVVTISGVTTSDYNGTWTVASIPTANATTTFTISATVGPAVTLGSPVLSQVPGSSLKWTNVFPFTYISDSVTGTSSNVVSAIAGATTSTTLTLTSGSTAGVVSGYYVVGTGIPAGTKVNVVTNSSSLTMTVPSGSVSVSAPTQVTFVPNFATSFGVGQTYSTANATSIYGYKNKGLSTLTSAESTTLAAIIADLKTYGLIS